MRTAILISGRGSNMAALLKAAKRPDYPAQIVSIIADRDNAPGLNLAQTAGISTEVIAREDCDRAAFDATLDARLAALAIDLICLAGFMRLLTAPFAEAWAGRVLNIHPSLLPAFKGRHAHHQALAAGVAIHGCTVHFVTPAMDAGPIIGQAAVPVLPGDNVATLQQRVLAAEHRLYPACLAAVASGQSYLQEGRVRHMVGYDPASAEQLLLNAPLRGNSPHSANS